jgi:hypothetical protein
VDTLYAGEVGYLAAQIKSVQVSSGRRGARRRARRLCPRAAPAPGQGAARGPRRPRGAAAGSNNHSARAILCSGSSCARAALRSARRRPQRAALLPPFALPQDARVGDTVTLKKVPAATALSGYEDVQPMVYCGLFPTDADDYQVRRRRRRPRLTAFDRA